MPVFLCFLPLPQAVHQHRDQSARRSEDVLLAPLALGPVSGQKGHSVRGRSRLHLHAQGNSSIENSNLYIGSVLPQDDFAIRALALLQRRTSQ